MNNTDLKFFTNEPERDLYSRFAAILKAIHSFSMFLWVTLGQVAFSKCMKRLKALKNPYPCWSQCGSLYGENYRSCDQRG